MADINPELTAKGGPPSRREKQLSVRSTKAVELARQKAHESGLSMTQVVEQALAGFHTAAEAEMEGMIREGKFLVIKSTGSGPKTNDEANHLIEMLRTEWADE